MRKTNLEFVWVIESIHDACIIGTFDSKFNALQAIRMCVDLGEFTAPSLGEKMPMNDQSTFVKIEGGSDKGSRLLFIRKELKNSSVGLFSVFDNH